MHLHNTTAFVVFHDNPSCTPCTPHFCRRSRKAEVTSLQDHSKNNSFGANSNYFSIEQKRYMMSDNICSCATKNKTAWGYVQRLFQKGISLQERWLCTSDKLFGTASLSLSLPLWLPPSRTDEEKSNFRAEWAILFNLAVVSEACFADWYNSISHYDSISVGSLSKAETSDLRVADDDCLVCHLCFTIDWPLKGPLVWDLKAESCI